MKIRDTVLIFSFVFLLLQNHPSLKAEESPPNTLSQQETAERKLLRLNHPTLLKAVQPDRIIKTIKPNIKPDFIILDIGAGTGIFTFLFAEALHGKGKVYATETDPAMIKYLQERISESKYRNVFPVLVQQEGLDPFYKKHKFDIIFMAKVYQALFDPESYLKELRLSLNKDGRLYIISRRVDPDVSEDRLDDFKKIIGFLAIQEADYPFFQRLDERTKHFIRNWRNQEIPENVKKDIIASFNKMLSDPSLYNDLKSYHYYKSESKKLWEENLNPTDYSLAFWLIILLDESQAFEKGKVLSETDLRQLYMLNRLLIFGTFGRQPVGPEVQFGKPVIAEKKTIIRTAEKAGYRFVREYDFLSKFYFLEFEPFFSPDENKAAKDKTQQQTHL